jgi:hypothetical protein
MAPIERALLPPDTLLERAEYRAAAGDGLVATLVCSGRDRSSIHRPEMCLSGDVTDTREISIDLPGRGPLSLRLLTLVRGQGSETGQSGKTTMYYAYWFTSGEHETSSHIERMMLMASDRVFHGVARRWAYVSVAGKMPANGDPTPQLREFLREFVPQLAPR